MNWSKVMLVLIAWGTGQSHACSQAANAEAAPKTRAPIRVLLETMHHQATLRDMRFNFSQLMMKKVLSEEGALVDDSSVTFGKPENLSKEGLKPYDLIILNGRLSGNALPDAFSPTVIKLIEDHVFRGGFLLVIGGSTEFGTGEVPGFYNPLLSLFGMTFNDKPSAVSGTQMHASELEPDREHPLLHDLEVLYPCHGTTLTLATRKAHPLAFLGDEPCLAVAPHGFGWVIALGGGSGWMNQGMDPQRNQKAGSANANQQFIRNVVMLVSVVRKGPKL